MSKCPYMPRTQSANKALRQSFRKRQNNLNKLRSLKTSIKNYKKALITDDKELLKNSLSVAYKALDKAAKTKLIKKNKASRIKSRLAQRITKSSKTSS